MSQMNPCESPDSLSESGVSGASGAGFPSQSAIAWRAMVMLRPSGECLRKVTSDSLLPFPPGDDEQRDRADRENGHHNPVLPAEHLPPVFGEALPVAAEDGGPGRRTELRGEKA